MMISYIQSNFKGFGSGVVAPGGITFHNRGMSFSLQDGHPNQVNPGKQQHFVALPFRQSIYQDRQFATEEHQSMPGD